VPLLQHPLQPLLVLHTQLPPEHVVPVGHALLQWPQLLLSFRLLHVVPQSICPAPQPLTHMKLVPDAEQLGSDAGQIVPQAPQFWAEERSTVHPADPLPEQYVQPAWQEDVGTLHVPPLHVTLPATWGNVVQSFPHDPQLCSSPRQPPLHACPGQAASATTSFAEGASATPVSVVTVESMLPVSGMVVSALES
jgi:hypothetical protein